MLPGTTVAQKLDLSKLTDEEAKHVWAVVQRDFNLRKKEEDRLGQLKTRIQKEDSKRELLGPRTGLTQSHCIRCLQPFKFLLNSRRRCLDCSLHICKACSRYSQKEEGWLCDACHMTRVLKIGTWEWYHENVRARFKRFGSANVMHSLFTRLNRQESFSQRDIEDGFERDSADSADSQHYKKMEKSKKRLSVDPFDLHSGRDYFLESRRRSNQNPAPAGIMDLDEGVTESMLADADMASVFHQILEKKNNLGLVPRPVDIRDDHSYPDNRILSRSVSRLSYSSCGSGGALGPRCSFVPGPDDSEGEEDHSQHYPLYQSHLGAFNHTFHESLNSFDAPPQVRDLSRRVSAIENLLNHLEQKVTSTYNQAPPTPSSSSTPPQCEEMDSEEQQLRQKLHEMTDNISDHSSDEDEPSRPEENLQHSRIPTRPTSRSSSIVSRHEEEEPQWNHSEKTSLERRWRPPEEESQESFRGSTALLVELEDKVAQAAAEVQSAQSEVSYIENRITALNAAGLPGDRRRKSAIPIQARRLSQNYPTSQMGVFLRNSLYLGSLTQRIPKLKTKTRGASAEPVMTQSS